ncbi:conserved hypothetical protein [Desulforapulum autotrophicum HRM2]|uniref:DUF4194 domain-containing protein n=1 Tax=Desulforapulum autotrophicum (strain ATCC 43914 / DSM 3382 / VKM B-1955 / HRM2) TaxID=177437 RepID=C0QGQ0_DESAH|nr:DUF4194 domain-containing protein [Desulforapulum autotrophicum]ACN13525.1 conserved hypothetical protein [Desulforapulum autotrophicum HRM2]
MDILLESMSKPVIALMKGVVFRENDERLWQQLEDGQSALRDYVQVLGLELIVDASEGYAWLKTREPLEGEEPLPRLVGRRKLSYPVSLIIALLRKKLAENDSSGEETRLILSVEEITDMVKVFFPAGGNEARLVDRINSHLNKIADLGFIRRLKGRNDKIEVIRILKAFVDAQWLHDFDERLNQYRETIGAGSNDQGHEN